METHTNSLARARSFLENTGRFPGGALPRDISESWMRSLSHGVDPLDENVDLVVSDGDLRMLQQEHATLIRFARPEIELLFDQIAGSNFLVALGTPSGIIIDSLVDPRCAESGIARSAILGSIWSEEARGTNALGVSSFTGRPAQVYGGEHFLRSHSDVACISAPIFDGRSNVVGILDASCPYTARQQHTAALVQMSANNIENCLIRANYSSSVVLQFHPRAEYLNTLSAGLLVLDEERCIIALNRRGEVILNGIDARIGGRFEDLFNADFGGIIRSLVNGETLRLRDRLGSAVSIRCIANRASFRLAGMRHAEREHPVRVPASSGGGVVRCSPQEIGFKIGNHIFGDRYLLSQIGNLPKALASAKPIHLCGAHGTGRDTLCKLVHRAHAEPGDLVVIDCRAVSSDRLERVLGQSVRASGSGSSGTEVIYLNEVDALGLEAQRVLAGLLAVRGFVPGELPDRCATLVSSSTRDLRRLAADGSFDVSLSTLLTPFQISLPDLHRRSDRIELVRHVLRRELSQREFCDDLYEVISTIPHGRNIHDVISFCEWVDRVIGPATVHAGHVEQYFGSGAHEYCAECAGVLWKEQNCRFVRAAVSDASGNISEAARRLGLSRTTVYKHMQGQLTDKGKRLV